MDTLKKAVRGGGANEFQMKSYDNFNENMDSKKFPQACRDLRSSWSLAQKPYGAGGSTYIHI